jgi:hypothetical protein
MSDRFNFYDLYGYVVPGFVLIALFWLPFGWTGQGWPSAGWTSAAAAFAVSYVAGILLQSIGTEAVPSKTGNAGNGGRYPSNLILDDVNTTFSSEFKTKLKALIIADFSLPVDTDLERADAFRACRSALVANKMAKYAEQFQGLYALARGLLLSIGLAVPFFLGWAIGVFRAPLFEWDWWSVVATLVASAAWYSAFAGDGSKKTFSSWDAKKRAIIIGPAVALPFVVYAIRFMPVLAGSLFAGPRRTALWIALPFVAPLIAVLMDKTRLRSRCGRGSIALSAFVVVAALGFSAAGTSVSTAQGQRLLSCAIAGGVALLPLWLLYRSHTETFATTVYRDYYAMRKLAPPAPSSSGAGESVGPGSGRGAR